MKKINLIFLFIFIIILILGLWYYSTIQEYIPLKDYTYSVSPSDVDYIYNLEIYHNFSKSEGMIIFDFEKDGAPNKTNPFEIGLPTIAEKIKIYKEINGTTEEYFDFGTKINIGTKENFTWIFLGDEIPLKENAKYIINYDMELNPNCLIRLEHFNVKTFGYSPKIYLTLGKDFLCTVECVETKQNMEINYWSTENELILEPALNNYEENTNYYHSARLHVINDIRTQQGILLGLIISSLFLILTTLKEIFERRIFN